MLVDASTDAAVLPVPGRLRNSLHIGGVTLTLSGSTPDAIRLGHELKSFLALDHDSDIEVSAEFVDALSPQGDVPSFNSGALWRVFPHPDGLTFDFVSEMLSRDPYKRLIVDREFSTAHLLLNSTLLAPYAPIFPLEYPTDELLITNYLASHRLGVEVHGCGLIDTAIGGQLFLGHSGAGKSTTTRLWQALRNPFILSDDRIILRLESGELVMHGTPWHGEAAFAEQGTSNLRRIFVLRHGPINRIRQLPKSLAVGEIFARSFPPFHSAQGVEGVIDFISRVVERVPCYEFQFVPDASAVNAIVDFHD